MAKKKTTRSRAKTKKPSIDWGMVGRWSLRTGAVLLLIALAIGLTFGVDRMRTHADGHLRLASARTGGPSVAIGFVWPSLEGKPGETWLPLADQEELIRVAGRAVGEDAPLSAAPLRRVAAELGRKGWFVGEPVVRRTGAGRMLVDGTWRIPAAVVRWDGHDQMISAGGLPMTPAYMPGRSELPVITGAYVGPVLTGPDGFQKEWRDPGVAVALDLIAVLRANKLVHEIAGIDVARYLNGGPIEILSPDGNRVVWGSPIDDFTPGEPSVEDKVERLRLLVARTGTIDAGQAVIEIHKPRVEIDRSSSGGGSTSGG